MHVPRLLFTVKLIYSIIPCIQGGSGNETQTAKLHLGTPVTSEGYIGNELGSAYIVFAVRSSDDTFCVGVLKSRNEFWTTTLCAKDYQQLTLVTGSRDFGQQTELHPLGSWPAIQSSGVVELTFSPSLDTKSLTKIPEFYKGIRPPPADTECVTYGYSRNSDGGEITILGYLYAKVTDTATCGASFDGLQGTNFCATIIPVPDRVTVASPICPGDVPTVLVCNLLDGGVKEAGEKMTGRSQGHEETRSWCYFHPDSAGCAQFCATFPIFCGSTTTTTTTQKPETFSWVVTGIQARETSPCLTLSDPPHPILYTLFPNYFSGEG